MRPAGLPLRGSEPLAAGGRCDSRYTGPLTSGDRFASVLVWQRCIICVCSGASWLRWLLGGLVGGGWLPCKCHLCNFYWFGEAQGFSSYYDLWPPKKFSSRVVKHSIVNLAWMTGGSQGFLLSFTAPIGVLCDSQGFCRAQFEKHECKSSAVNSRGTSAPYFLPNKYVRFSFVIGELESSSREWHKWSKRIFGWYVVDDIKYLIPSYHRLVCGGSLVPLKSVGVVQFSSSARVLPEDQALVYHISFPLW